VLARVKPGDRVALLGGDAVLAERLVAAGCAVLELSGAPEVEGPLAARLAGLAPSHVVLPGDVALPVLEGLLRTATEAVPGAMLLVGVRNASSATVLLRALCGQPPEAPGATEASLERCFSRLGLRVLARQALPCEPRMTALAAGTESALRALLAQLSPAAEVDVLLYALTPSGERREVPACPPVPGLLSVVLLSGDAWARSLLDEALFSLACQEYQPLELVLVTPAGDAEARALVERYQALGGYTFQHVEAEARTALGEGIRHARGQYVSFLDAACVVYPDHYVRLVRALREGPVAWAVSRARRTPLEGAERFVTHKRPLPLGEHLEFVHLHLEPALLFALVVNRTRLGPFPLEQDATSPEGLPLRLAALFEPTFLGGIASCEQRFTGPEREEPAGPLPELKMLCSLGAVEERVARARADGASAKGLRHRFLDDLNARLRREAPRLHGALKSLAARLAR
jgi:hypothetical protein